MSEALHVTLSGDLSGQYVVEDLRPDGTAVIRPEVSAGALERRHDLAPATLAEFEAEYGPVAAADGEG